MSKYSVDRYQIVDWLFSYLRKENYLKGITSHDILKTKLKLYSDRSNGLESEWDQKYDFLESRTQVFLTKTQATTLVQDFLDQFEEEMTITILDYFDAEIETS